MLGRRIKFLCRPPIDTAVPGLAKHETSIKYGEPSGASVPGRRFGSQRRTVRAFMSTPVKSEMFAEEDVTASVHVKHVPGPNSFGLTVGIVVGTASILPYS